jgi:dimethylhistidine N-methyltransferase
MPVDISKRALEETGRCLTAVHPGLTIRAIRADFERACALLPRDPSLVLFLGSNIGNLDRAESVRFLSALRGHQVLVGFDMQKDPGLLLAAYNDAQGVTAQFNLNLLARINRELDGNFDLARWNHLSFYDATARRVEMHLVSQAAQAVRLRDASYLFDAGERIHTENSHKFSDEQIRAIAAESGLRVERQWTDDHGWFSVVLLS